MCRSNFYRAGTKFLVDKVIGDNRDFSVCKREYNGFANKVGESFIRRVYRDGSITEHRFGAGCRNHDRAVSIRVRIFEIP